MMDVATILFVFVLYDFFYFASSVRLEVHLVCRSGRTGGCDFVFHVLISKLGEKLLWVFKQTNKKLHYNKSDF